MTAQISDASFRERAGIEGDLGLFLCEYVWGSMDTLDLGGQEFEVVGGEEVPGYEDDDEAVLLRRKPDGQVFEVYIEVTARRVGKPAQVTP